MKILSINGSPRGHSSNTNKMIIEILKGAEEKGAETEKILLSELDIKHCRGCFCCWMNKNNKCIINDDMEELIEKYTKSDIVIYGTPLFMDNVSSILKVFIDRCIAIVCPYMERDAKGEYRHVKSSSFRIPKFVVVSNAAFPENSQFQVVSHYFKRLARSMHTEVIAEIYRGQGLLLALPKHADDRYIIDNYKKLLYRAGKEIVENFVINEKTQTEIDKSLVSYDKYINGIEDYWKKVLED